MHYRTHGLLIKSENAAKSAVQSSRPLVDWLKTHVSAESALDYGCGRLRYSHALAARCRLLGLVDSSEQLDRETQAAGRMSTIRALAQSTWPTCRIHTVSEFWRGVPERYDFVLCANVLSAIPSAAIRRRSLEAVRDCLERAGQLLVVNQHTNSYFTSVRSSPRAIEHLDGWILRSPKGAAYFGVLNRDRTIALLRARGFQIRDAWLEGQSNYVLASK